MFGKVTDDSFPSIFDLSLDGEDHQTVAHKLFGNSFLTSSAASNGGGGGNGLGLSLNTNRDSSASSSVNTTSSSSSPLSSRREFPLSSNPSSALSTPSSSTSLPLEQAFSQFASSFSSLLAERRDRERDLVIKQHQFNVNNSYNTSSASSTTSSTNNNSNNNSNANNANSKVNASRYKTELCRPFGEHGTCKYGDKCQFAHGQEELRIVSRHPKYKTDLCKTYHSVGFCPYGPRCHFIHNLDELSSKKTASTASTTSRGSPVDLKSLPQNMFDAQQQQQHYSSAMTSSRNDDPKGLKAWSPLQSNFQVQRQQQQSNQLGLGRLPVFSTLSE